METTQNTKRAECLLEWWDERKGSEVYAEVLGLLYIIGGTVLTEPHESNLTYQPKVKDCEYSCEGELWFTFAHTLDYMSAEGDIMRRAFVNAVRSVCRLKFLDLDMDLEREYEDDF